MSDTLSAEQIQEGQRLSAVIDTCQTAHQAASAVAEFETWATINRNGLLSMAAEALRLRAVEQKIADEFNAGLRGRCSMCEAAFPKNQVGSYGSYCAQCHEVLTLHADLQRVTVERDENRVLLDLATGVIEKSLAENATLKANAEMLRLVICPSGSITTPEVLALLAGAHRQDSESIDADPDHYDDLDGSIDRLRLARVAESARLRAQVERLAKKAEEIRRDTFGAGETAAEAFDRVGSFFSRELRAVLASTETPEKET